ncbi:MAG: WbuC family cupin fold metalloprotein [Prevotella sp.]|nr:WbuC family cupin fold metalloprotein [Prevotella sp.]
MMIEIDRKLLSDLFDKAVINPRLRQNFDLRNPDDNGQRILNALMPGTIVPIHRHPQSNETVIILCGKVIEIIYDDNGNEIERVHLDPSLGNFGCVVPTGAWHSVEVLEPSVIFEAKDGKYGQDGSETLADYEDKAKTPTPSTFSNSLGDLKKNIEYIIGMECQSGNIETPTPQDIARILNVPVEEVRQCMKEMGL